MCGGFEETKALRVNKLWQNMPPCCKDLATPERFSMAASTIIESIEDDQAIHGPMQN